MSFGRPRVFQARKMWKSKIKSGEKYVYIEYSKNRVIAKIEEKKINYIILDRRNNYENGRNNR